MEKASFNPFVQISVHPNRKANSIFPFISYFINRILAGNQIADLHNKAFLNLDNLIEL